MQIIEIISIEKLNNFKHLIIITDGQVDFFQISLADIRMEKIDYNLDFVSIYIFGPHANLIVGVFFVDMFLIKHLPKNIKLMNVKNW